MIGEENTELDVPEESPRAHSKKRFPLGLYSHLRKEQMHNELPKKLDCEEKIKAMRAQLHRIEERIHHKKWKVISFIIEVTDQSECEVVENKKARLPHTTSGLLSKKKYTSIRNTIDVVKESGKNCKNKKTEFMKNCEIPKIESYKTLTSVSQRLDAGEMIHLETFAARFNVEAFPGVYRPLKPFLLQLADLYLFLDERVPCLHWFNGEKNVLYIAIGGDGAPFRRNDTATGNYISC
ncbi:unnamed protein product [Porites evermanni]|uniref:Uncharacterized protein n=1 Tax=Porites evermanni TaxID=104178 RepID=A0ABN8RCM8_9CNID|nr:unnamed protein product [Porites evermanni]